MSITDTQIEAVMEGRERRIPKEIPVSSPPEPRVKFEVRVKEQGVSITGLPSNKQTRKFTEAAKLTGDSDILSADDALAQQLIEEREQEAGRNKNAKEEIAKLGVNGALATFPEPQRTALKNQAVRFMADAKTLVQRLKK